VLNIGDIIVTTEAAPDGTGEILNPTYSVFGLSYGRRNDGPGASWNHGELHQREGRADLGTGFAADLGVQYDTGWRGLSSGFAMKNIGPNMNFQGPDFEERFTLPGTIPRLSRTWFACQAADFELPPTSRSGSRTIWEWRRSSTPRSTARSREQFLDR